MNLKLSKKMRKVARREIKRKFGEYKKYGFRERLLLAWHILIAR